MSFCTAVAQWWTRGQGLIWGEQFAPLELALDSRWGGVTLQLARGSVGVRFVRRTPAARFWSWTATRSVVQPLADSSNKLGTRFGLRCRRPMRLRRSVGTIHASSSWRSTYRTFPDLSFVASSGTQQDRR